MEKEVKEQDEQYDMVSKVKLVYEIKCVKEFRVTGHLNGTNTKRWLWITIHQILSWGTTVIYSFKSEIHRGAGEIADYSKTLTTLPDMFTSLEEIHIYFEECEQKRLDLKNVEVWSKAYLPATRTTETWGNYQGKVIFKHVQIRLVASDWFRKKRCIYGIDTFDDNMCAWRCLAIYKPKDIKRGTEFVTKAALNLAREYYGDNKLRQKDVWAIKTDNFEGIAKHHNVNIMLYEPKKDNGKDSGSIWQLVYGKI